MTTATVLLQLAERCEREEPSAILDEAISRAITPPVLRGWHLKSYTISLDAAVTLVPKGFYWSLDYDCYARVIGPEDRNYEVPIGVSDRTTKTPALALCAAALRARAALLEKVPA